MKAIWHEYRHLAGKIGKDSPRIRERLFRWLVMKHLRLYYLAWRQTVTTEEAVAFLLRRFLENVECSTPDDVERKVDVPLAVARMTRQQAEAFILRYWMAFAADKTVHAPDENGARLRWRLSHHKADDYSFTDAHIGEAIGTIPEVAATVLDQAREVLQGFFDAERSASK